MEIYLKFSEPSFECDFDRDFCHYTQASYLGNAWQLADGESLQEPKQVQQDSKSSICF